MGAQSNRVIKDIGAPIIIMEKKLLIIDPTVICISPAPESGSRYGNDKHKYSVIGGMRDANTNPNQSGRVCCGSVMFDIKYSFKKQSRPASII